MYSTGDYKIHAIKYNVECILMWCDQLFTFDKLLLEAVDGVINNPEGQDIVFCFFLNKHTK